MTEPLVNTSIRAFGQLKGTPASAARLAVKNIDWGAGEAAPDIVGTIKQKKINQYEDDIQSPLKQMGIQPQYMISLPCVEVNEMANKRIFQGRGPLFNGQLVVADPTTGMDEINFVPVNRIGRNGMDASQRPFNFGSFQYAC